MATTLSGVLFVSGTTIGSRSMLAVTIWSRREALTSARISEAAVSTWSLPVAWLAPQLPRATGWFDSAEGGLDGERYDHLVLRAATDHTWVRPLRRGPAAAAVAGVELDLNAP